MLKLIDKLKPWQVAIIFVVVGFLVFFSGLNSPFQNDDSYQIVNNIPVHSLSNLPSFFGSSTFYNGEKLTGVYYRPLMTTTFSIIYSIVGANPFLYHFVQLCLYIAGAFVLFLVLSKFFNRCVSMALSLIFLVHPLNSQIVFSIPTMQDALFFMFGILALWNLINNKNLWKVVLLLFLTLLSKEAGLLFVFVSILYLVIFDKSRIKEFLKVLFVPFVLYWILKISAVGFSGAHHAAPINELDLAERLFTAPSILLFYIGKLLYPEKLSLGYYWTHPGFSVEYFLIPLLIDLFVVGIILYLGYLVKIKLSKKDFKIFVFFAGWSAMGIGLYLQIIPGLDFTACETWAYFAMAGFFGMIGVSLKLFKRIKYGDLILVAISVLIIIALGIRSNIRGGDYSSQYNLANVDLSVSSDNFSAMNNISQYLISQGKYEDAVIMARRSIDIYPIVSNHINHGVALQYLGRYKEAKDAYGKALVYGNLNIIYQNLALIHIVDSKPSDTDEFFKIALKEYPRDFKLWLYYAVFSGAIGSKAEAVDAIKIAKSHGDVPDFIYSGITNGVSFSVPILGKNVLVK